MTNMRRGFTMIELIFVIVIIGILAAVAIPKLADTANEARKSTIIGFVGTLNRSAGPAMWATAVNKASPNTGSVVNPTPYNLADYTDIPTGVSITGLAGCGQDDGNLSNGADYGLIGTVTSLPQPESIYCLDGSGTDSPKFAFDVNGSQVLMNN